MAVLVVETLVILYVYFIHLIAVVVGGSGLEKLVAGWYTIFMISSTGDNIIFTDYD